MRVLMELTIIGAVLTSVLLLLKSPLIKRFGGSWYYYIWTAVLFSFCFPYKIDFTKYFFKVPNNTILVSLAADSVIRQNAYKGAATGVNMYNAAQSTEMASEYIQKGIFMLYVIGVLAALMYYAGMYISFRHKLKRSAYEVQRKDYINCLDSLCREMNIKREIHLMASESVSSPIFTGIIRPSIILPKNDILLDDLRLILKHELTHYKRGDMIYKAAALAVHIIHWYNPFSYLALRTINEACEYSCDEAVTKNMDTDERKRYGYMLLNQVQSSADKTLFAAMFSKNGKHILKRRFEIIMSERKYKYIKITASFLCAAILITGFFDLKPINAFADGDVVVYENDAIKSSDVTTEETIDNSETTGILELEKISEEQAVEMAKSAIKKYYDIDVDSLVVDATYIEEGSGSVQPVGWFIRIFPDDVNKTCDYAAWIDPKGETVRVSVSGLWENAEIIGEDSISEIESDNGWIEKISEISGEPIENIKNIYFENLDESIGEKMVNVNYELNDGSTYTATLTYPGKELKGISIPGK